MSDIKPDRVVREVHSLMVKGPRSDAIEFVDVPHGSEVSVNGDFLIVEPSTGLLKTMVYPSWRVIGYTLRHTTVDNDAVEGVESPS